ncbi:carbohydrate ABC transporter permease [Cohnella soli]|uniref:Carbohydrate ABC transporter permease n=1 Tax=Cohnella soli TaxID=425005 RepID=A0ABW0HZ31_9BACL
MAVKPFPRFVAILALVFFLAITLVPFALLLIVSLRDNLDLMIQFWSWPEQLKWSNYADAFAGVKSSIGNSLFVCSVTVIGAVALASLSGYAFARFRFAGRGLLFLMLLGVLMIPVLLTYIPLYSIIVTFKMTNTYWALILPYIAGSHLLGIMLCRTFFESLPDELFEAARMDGANELYVYGRIALPLSVPVLMTLGIVVFIAMYGDYLWPLLVLDESKYTFAVAAAKLNGNGRQDIGLSFAGYVIGSVPMIAVMAIGMKYYVEGLVSGAVKS